MGQFFSGKCLGRDNTLKLLSIKCFGVDHGYCQPRITYGTFHDKINDSFEIEKFRRNEFA